MIYDQCRAVIRIAGGAFNVSTTPGAFPLQLKDFHCGADTRKCLFYYLNHGSVDTLPIVPKTVA
jgi:hypothetical protein